MSNKMLEKKLIRNFITYGTLKSSDKKIKYLKEKIEKIVNLGKKNTRATINEISKKISHKQTEQKLFNEIIPVFKDKVGGYVKVTKLKVRISDGSKISKLEWSIPVIAIKKTEVSQKKEVKVKIKPKTKKVKK